MTLDELQKALDAHCEDMKNEMPGFLYYGVLKCSDGEVIASAQVGSDLANKVGDESSSHWIIMKQVKDILNSSVDTLLKLDFITIETDKISYIITLSALGKFFSITGLERKRANLGYSRNLLTKCKAQFGTALDDIYPA